MVQSGLRLAITSVIVTSLCGSTAARVGADPPALPLVDRYAARTRVVVMTDIAAASYRRVVLNMKSAPRGAQVPPPVELTAEQDHARLMGLLGIQSIRPGADPRNPQAPNAVNYDEARANPYPVLPDPLVLKTGKRVTNAKMWWETRRPEIVEDFDREVYGRVPKDVPPVRWEVKAVGNEAVGGVPVITKTLVGHVDNSRYPAISVDIEMTLSTPANATGPVPVVIDFGFRFPAGMTRPPRPPGAAAEGPSWQEQLVSKGWGYAVLYPNTIQADNGAGLTRGIIGLVNKGQPRTVDDWGALRAWAWGASRALDYLETDKDVNAKQVGIEGLSRYGKAALVTMAADPRFAIAFVASSGEGGAKLHRRNFGELVENVAGSGEYHWMAGNFIKYAGRLTAADLPVDAHELIALCAPRPVFISSGSFEVEGGWVDAKGMFLAAVGAGPVYRLLGRKDLGTTEFPPIGTALVTGDVAFRQHRGGHTAGPNWPTFLAFADRYIKAPPPRAPAADTRASAGGRQKVALTFDDLPVHAALPSGLGRSDIARSILSALAAHRAPPTYGFVNAKGLEEAPDSAEVLRLWRAAGNPLGNHTLSHMDLHANSTVAFEQEVVANEATLRTYMGDEGWRWLRFPYLHEGETIEKRREVSRFLKDRGYRVAQVTLNFDDWAFNDPYARCLAKNDAAAVEWMKDSYLRRAAESLSAGVKRARLVFGREIAHVMLLHLGALQTAMLPRLLDLLEEQGFELVTLQEAQSDPAYAVEVDRPFPSGTTWLDQVAATKGLETARPSDDTLTRLSALCR
jgi:peptidoglycan/xylan/chitin deacetylase (PgdA/CDA1 family)